MEDLVYVMPWRNQQADNLVPLLDREWLVTNGLGGYASGTIAGAATRRYHGLLVAAHPVPLGRLMMFNHLCEQLRLPDWSTIQVGGEERVGGTLDLQGTEHLSEFRLEAGLPVWRYDLPGGHVVEKRLFMPHLQNTVYVTYHLVVGQGPLRLKLRPAVHFRGHDDPVSTSRSEKYTLTAVEGHYELSDGSAHPPLRLHLTGDGAALTLDGQRRPNILYRIEESRGYEATGSLWSPGQFRVTLRPGQDVALVASTENWDRVLALPAADAFRAESERRRRLLQAAAPEVLKSDHSAELVLAADQFLIVPATRQEDAARAHAAGDEARSVIAGYHWFTDWGRDTMISLEGLTLTTGRHAEAGYLLRTFAHYVKDGLIPNLFPEGQHEGLYHTADATLWYFHALDRYLAATGDRATLRQLLPKLHDIVDHHQRGTRFGIGVDAADGLLRQGAEGYQLTWMDAKVGDWVVTPRRGKAVEINALWYNALCLLAGWTREEVNGSRAAPLAEAAARARESFNRRFWCAAQGHLYDVVDGERGDDAACRPNQIFAISLQHPILDANRWQAVLRVVRDRLLTPVGLRSLAPGHPDYKAKYYGDLRARDAAYHQGTVWAWLIGPFVDAWLRVYPEDRVGARRFLEGFKEHRGEACIGSISEVFDAEAPFTPRGCIAQAWSVAEVLRAWARTAPP
jgi:predicted glycogen debranching enzyme